MVNNFIWNDVWTFRNRRGHRFALMLGRFLRFNVVCSVGMIITIGGLHTVCGFNLYVANPVVISAVAVGLCGSFACELRNEWVCGYGDW